MQAKRQPGPAQRAAATKASTTGAPLGHVLANPAGARADDVLDLQRAAGNSAVQQLVGGVALQRDGTKGSAPPRRPPPLPPSRPPRRPPPPPPRKKRTREEIHGDAAKLLHAMTSIVDEAAKTSKDATTALASPASATVGTAVTDATSDALGTVRSLVVESAKTVILPRVGKSTIPEIVQARAAAATKARSIAVAEVAAKKTQILTNPLAATATKMERYQRQVEQARVGGARAKKAEADLAEALVDSATSQAATMVLGKKVQPGGLFGPLVQGTEGAIRTAAQDAAVSVAGSEGDNTSFSLFQGVVQLIRDATDDVKVVLSALTPSAHHEALLLQVQKKLDDARALNASLATSLAGTIEPAITSAAKQAATDVANEKGQAAGASAVQLLKAVKMVRDEIKKDAAKLGLDILNADDTSSDELKDAKAAAIGDAVKATLDAEGSLDSKLAIVGKLIDAAVPRNGDKSELDVLVKVPVDPTGTAYLGLHFTGSLEKDMALGASSPTTKVGLSLTIVGGGELPIGADLMGELGGYLEAASGNGGKGAMNMISFGLYRRFRESNAVPQEIVNFLWGMGGVTKGTAESKGEAKRREASAWADAFEESMGDDDSFESGVKAAISGKGGVKNLASVSGSITGTTGRKYSKAIIAAERAKGGGMLKKLFGGAKIFGMTRGSEETIGKGVSTVAVKVGAEAGPFSGEGSAKLSFQDSPFKLEEIEAGVNFGFKAPSGTPANNAEVATKIITGLGQTGKTIRKAVETVVDGVRAKEGKGKSKTEVAGATGSLLSDLAGSPSWFLDAGQPFGTAYLTKISDQTVGQSSLVKKLLPGETARSKYLSSTTKDVFGESKATGAESVLSSSVALKLGGGLKKEIGKGVTAAVSLDMDKGLSVGLPKLIEAKLTKTERIVKAQVWPKFELYP